MILYFLMFAIKVSAAQFFYNFIPDMKIAKLITELTVMNEKVMEINL